MIINTQQMKPRNGSHSNLISVQVFGPLRQAWARFIRYSSTSYLRKPRADEQLLKSVLETNTEPHESGIIH